MNNIILYITILFCIILTFIKTKKTEITNLMDKQSTDTFRGLAIIAIVFTHYTQININSNAFLSVFLYTGGICTGVFFFLSGYANYYSLQKNETKSIIWLINKVSRIFFTYLIVYFIDIILLKIFNNEIIPTNIVFEQLLTMKLPNWINWYLKVQVGAYIFYWLVFNTKKYEVISLFVISIIFIYIMRKNGFPDFWWNSILCFPLGVMIARYKNKIVTILDKKYILALLIPLCLFFVMTFNMNIEISAIYGILSPILFCIMLIIFLSRYSVKSTILGFVGSISLEIYLWHLVFIKIFFTGFFVIKNIHILLIIFYASILVMSYSTQKLIKFALKRVR